MSNMNDCRDAWAELMRTAAQQQAGQLKSFVNTQSHPSANDLKSLLQHPGVAFCIFAAAYLPTSALPFPQVYCFPVPCYTAALTITAWLHQLAALAKWLTGKTKILMPACTLTLPLVYLTFKTRFTCHAGDSAAVLLYMQQHVRKPLRLLRHDNDATFAEIFTTALLQAAATGETLVGSDQSKSGKVLQKQADKDASKIFRLNQRMQVGCPNLYLAPTPTPAPLLLSAWTVPILCLLQALCA